MTHGKFLSDGCVIIAHRPWMTEDKRFVDQGWWSGPLYRKEVAEVCLNCTRPECIGGDWGCGDYKREVLNSVVRERQGKKR